MKTDALHIRQATPQDKDAIQALWKRVIAVAFENERFDDSITPARELSFKMNQLEDAFQNGTATYFVAYEGDALVGTIAYGTPPNRGILRHTGDALRDTMELGSLYIDPAQQKKGYGRILLIYALEALHASSVETVCFDSIYETSKRIWRRMFGEPTYNEFSPKHNFYHMIWVVDVAASIERLKPYTPQR